jgi:branched-subunit amino acid transport protein
MTAMIAMLALGAVCWVFRITFLALVPADRLPSRVSEGLEHLAPAVLAAIAAVEITDMLASANPSDGAGLVAGVIAVGLVAYRTRSLTTVALVGVAVVAVLDLMPW